MEQRNALVESQSLLVWLHIEKLFGQGVLTLDDVRGCFEDIQARFPDSRTALLARVRLDFPELSSELLSQMDTNHQELEPLGM
ncbi:hypothetical protein KJY77_00450 [Canibacter sp. lx-72]|uniref:hypothetical protein n=1 Tax=Canibacter zhuwentaonis TaxID=2837491 RepID=UPI001BDD6139|nr:hypothetical protein [Canibacter zhuwentaonis]MBT1017617.1 hypothetical protein [Canibacter zhuwentaonis]